MRYWLLTANPEKQGLGKIKNAEDLERYFKIISAWENWSIRTKKICLDHRFYLMLLGQGKMNGIIGRGTFRTWAYEGESWNNTGEKVLYANIAFEGNPKYIPCKALNEMMPDQLWTPRQSGISIKAKYTEELDALYQREGIPFL